MLTIEDVREAIAGRGAAWTAAETVAWRRLVVKGGASRGLFGLRLGDPRGVLEAASSDVLEDLTGSEPPTSVDWRTREGGRLSAVRDQGDCGACVAFATIAAVEAAHWIREGEPLELSEAELFHCGGGSCEDGWGLAAGLDAGIAGLSLLRDAAWSAEPSCLSAARAVSVAAFREHRSPRSRRRAVAAGPVVGGMRVHEDLSAYSSGVYRHLVGDFVADHAVCIVGYDDADGAWIVRNSWGDGWGEGGYGRIAYGECAIDDLPFYSCETRRVAAPA